VPVAFCTLFTTLIINRELGENDRYKRWWKDYSYTALALSIFSAVDNEALNVASSHFAGYRALSAPYTRGTDQRIILATVFIMFIEDIPQFIYLIIYQKVTIIPAIVPILALSSCTILIFIRIISIIYLAFICERERDRHDDEYDEELGEKDSIEEGAAPPEGPRNLGRQEPPALLVDLGSDENRKNGKSRFTPGDARSQNLSIETDKPIGKFSGGESHKAALIGASKNGKNGKTPRSPIEVEAHRSDISSDVEKPIGKYVESQMIDSPAEGGRFETRITQYKDEYGVIQTKKEQIFIPEVETITTVHEENIYIDSSDVHQQTHISQGGQQVSQVGRQISQGGHQIIQGGQQISQGGQGGHLISQVTRDESVIHELPATQSSTITTTTYVRIQNIRNIRDASSGQIIEQYTQEIQGEPHTHVTRTEETHEIPGGSETVITTETTTEYEESSQTQTFSHTESSKTNK
ncbi:17471_t:CDS:2, partial [Racocetra persica]